jgi:hypothetical protein
MIGGVEADIEARSVASSDGACAAEFLEMGRIGIADVFAGRLLGVVGMDGEARGGRKCGDICCCMCECEDTTIGCWG